MSDDSSVKVAVRIRPLSEEEELEDKTLCVNKLDEQQIVAGTDYAFTFDYAFGPDAAQSHLYETCVVDLLHAAFEGFNATILVSWERRRSGLRAFLSLTSPSLCLSPAGVRPDGFWQDVDDGVGFGRRRLQTQHRRRHKLRHHSAGDPRLVRHDSTEGNG